MSIYLVSLNMFLEGKVVIKKIRITVDLILKIYENPNNEFKGNNNEDKYCFS